MQLSESVLLPGPLELILGARTKTGRGWMPTRTEYFFSGMPPVAQLRHSTEVRHSVNREGAKQELSSSVPREIVYMPVWGLAAPENRYYYHTVRAHETHRVSPQTRCTDYFLW